MGQNVARRGLRDKQVTQTGREQQEWIKCAGGARGETLLLLLPIWEGRETVEQQEIQREEDIAERDGDMVVQMGHLAASSGHRYWAPRMME